MSCTTLRWSVLAATVALLVVGAATVAAEEKAGNLRLQRLLTESSCTTGTTAIGEQCTTGSDCASGYCVNVVTDVNMCNNVCAVGTMYVSVGDDCSCCEAGVARADTDNGYGQTRCAFPIG